MSKKPKLILDISEDDISFFGKEWLNLGELNNEIEKMENNIPDKRTKDYESWKNKINFLIETYNALASYRNYKKYE
jgi:hypothetical protein